MSISYHGVVGHTAKATLPSVETWGANMNILRDPPKSIHTRKIDKVGETSSITQMIQESGDRACEAIKVYARGVNPMVSVSYSNYGNNGGQRVEGQNNSGNVRRGAGQAFLPYTVNKDGAFRPPIRAPQDLLPLSRLPRVWTSSYTKPGFADFTKKAMCPGTDEDTAGVKKPGQMLKACVRPTATYNIKTPVVEPFEVRYVIQNPTHISGRSGKRTIGKVTTNVAVPAKEVIEAPVYAEVRLNKGGHWKKDAKLSHMSTERHMKDPLHSDVNAHMSQNIQVTPIDQLYNMDVEIRTRDAMHLSHAGSHIGYNKTDYIHEDLELSRVLPMHEAGTNKGQNIYHQAVEPIHRELSVNMPHTSARTNMGSGQHQVIDEITNRNVRLTPTINAGGFDGAPSMTRFDGHEEQEITEFDRHKTEMRRKIYEMQAGRQENRNPYV
jgi:hypothetical protein